MDSDGLLPVRSHNVLFGTSIFLDVRMIRSDQVVEVSMADRLVECSIPARAVLSRLSIKIMGRPSISSAVAVRRTSSSEWGREQVGITLPVVVMQVTSASRPLPVPGVGASTR